MGDQVPDVRTSSSDKQCHFCRSPSLGLLPACTVFITGTTFVTTYSIAVAKKHVWPLLPYISDTGTTVPESCIFSLGLSLVAIAMSCVMYARYKLLDALQQLSVVTRNLNIAALCFGLVANLGILIVGAFQEGSIRPVHDAGAFITFGCGGVYCIIHTIITHQTLQLMYGTRAVFWIRAVSSTLASLAAIVSIATGSRASHATAVTPGDHDSMHWQPTDPGYSLHLASTVSEWMAGAALQVFVLSFVPEFRRITHEFSHSRQHATSTDGSGEPFLQTVAALGP